MRLIGSGLLALLVLCSVFISTLSSKVVAATFNPNLIMHDAVMDNYNSMSASQIDALLNSFPNSCISTNNGFSAREPVGYNPTDGFLFGNNASAGTILYDAAQAYNINPQVLLVTLQKEQSLVKGDAGCGVNRYAKAMGYACPDASGSYSYSGLNLFTKNGITYTATDGAICVKKLVNGVYQPNPDAVGFTQQLIRAAWMLKYSEQRSKGNINWAIIKGNWNNSDDLNATYSGYMTQGCFKRSKYESTCTNYDGYITIDGSAVHLDSGATAALYRYTPHFAGNTNFFNLFTSWFGSPILPTVFKIEGDSAIYMQAGGYRFYVPSIAMLEDYGLGTGAQTISQAMANNIPLPDAESGLSSALNSIVKSPSDGDGDGGSVYLITAGRKFQFTSMQQITDFGYEVSDISYLPLPFLSALPSGGWLSNFIQNPSQAIFQVTNGQKRFIFDGPAYAAANPSGALSRVSNALADALPGGAPIASSGVSGLLSNSSGAIHLFVNNKYYYVPTAAVLDCWGFSTTLNMQVFRLPNDNYVAPISSSGTLGCSYKAESSTTYLLNGTNRILLPSDYGFSLGTLDSDIASVASKLPSRSTSIGRFVQSKTGASTWYLEAGIKKFIPSLFDLQLLGSSPSQVDYINPGAFAELPGNGLKMGVGQVVRASDTGAIYIITSSATKSWISTPEDFSAYGYSWSSVPNTASSLLNQYYTTNSEPLNNFMYNPAGSVYLMDPNACYGLTSGQVSAFGQPSNAAAAGQPYASTIFPFVNLTHCKAGSYYIKSSSQATVYFVENGTKHSVSNWSTFQTHSGQTSPYFITVANKVVEALATGPAL